MDNPPVHCDQPMQASYKDNGRVNYVCARGCGHRLWWPPADTTRGRQSVYSRPRSCKLCGGALPSDAHPVTQYHRRCRDKLKRQRMKDETAFRSETRRAKRVPTEAMKAEKERSLAGIRRKKS